MGGGSRKFFYHYAIFAFLYSVLAFILIGQSTIEREACLEQCPLLISNSTTLPYASCLCFGSNYNSSHEALNQLNNYALGYGPGNEQRNDLKRFIDVGRVNNRISPRKCYICEAVDKAQIYEPCESFADCEKQGVRGFRPAMDVNALCRLPPFPEASILTSPAVQARFLVNPLALSISTFYLLIGLCCFTCAIGYYVFRNKYLEYDGKLSQTELVFSYFCKVSPIIAHLLNFVVLILIIIFDGLIFGVRVCETSTNEFGEATFYSHITKVASAVSILWLVGTIFGTCINKHMGRDMSFYHPKHPIKPEASFCVKVGACTTNALIYIGP